MDIDWLFSEAFCDVFGLYDEALYLFVAAKISENGDNLDKINLETEIY